MDRPTNPGNADSEGLVASFCASSTSMTDTATGFGCRPYLSDPPELGSLMLPRSWVGEAAVYAATEDMPPSRDIPVRHIC